MRLIGFIRRIYHDARSPERQIVRTACRNDLPDDEHMMFETRRRHQELN